MNQSHSLDPANTAGEWTQLNASCTHCISLAHTLGTQLKGGATTEQLNGLLQKSAEEVRQLQAGIRQLAQRALREDDVQQQQQLMEQMQTLLHLEERNHSLLGSKGIALNRPRPYRYQPRRRTRSE